MTSLASKAALRGGVFLVAAVFTSLLFINVCDLFYQCGCDAWWAGAAAHCNIHNASGPHCPWCLDGGVRGYAVYGLVLAVQAAVAFRPGETGWFKRFGLALAAFPLVGGLAALVFGLTTDYWS
jgi:hypothetical protein